MIVARILLGLLIGTICGAFICALAFALLSLLSGNTSGSLGGFATVENPTIFEAIIGAFVGAILGTIIGFIVGITNAYPLWGGAIGAITGIVATGIILLRRPMIGGNDIQYALIIAFIGAVIGLAVAFLLKLMWVTSKPLP